MRSMELLLLSQWPAMTGLTVARGFFLLSKLLLLTLLTLVGTGLSLLRLTLRKDFIDC